MQYYINEVIIMASVLIIELDTAIFCNIVQMSSQHIIIIALFNCISLKFFLYKFFILCISK